MLDYLHKKISEIVDIDGVYLDEESGEYVVSYKQEPSEELFWAVREIILTLTLEWARINKIKDINVWWEQLTNIGWQTPYGWNLGMSTNDVALLNGVFTLAKEAAQLGVTEEVFIIDTEGNSHSFNLEDLTMLMLQYGQARASFSQLYAQKMRDAKEALSIPQLEWIECQL
jgi:hypothetical protein